MEGIDLSDTDRELNWFRLPENSLADTPITGVY